MCGIYAHLSLIPESGSSGNAIQNRGPDNTTTESVSKYLQFTFHRLKINDLSDDGNQPIHYEDVTLICNGEIYNSDELKNEVDSSFNSSSDCEVLPQIYKKYGFEEMCRKIDGVFALVLYDRTTDTLWIGRDPYGVRPMFFGRNELCITISSEMKAINLSYEITQFPPGRYMQINCNNLQYTNPIVYHNLIDHQYNEPHYSAANVIKNSLEKSVIKRLMSDRPIGCLLSGGLDSSIVCSIVSKEFKKRGKGLLNTFSIGFEGSTDLKYAKKVAEYIGSVHHEILLTQQDFLDAIPEVIYTIESYDTTTVRASVGNYLVSKYIKENTDITVVFNGDGADEVAGGYLYLQNAPNNIEFHNECLRLLDEISYFDVLRSDRSLSSKWGLESRTPYLDKSFVSDYISMPIKHRNTPVEKHLLRYAFKDSYLPDEVLWRTKEAFSDGVSGSENSWHKVIQKFIDSKISDSEYLSNRAQFPHNMPLLKESYYYRMIFEECYPMKSHVIPHFWMPKWTDSNDPSARELK